MPTPTPHFSPRWSVSDEHSMNGLAPQLPTDIAVFIDEGAANILRAALVRLVQALHLLLVKDARKIVRGQQ